MQLGPCRSIVPFPCSPAAYLNHDSLNPTCVVRAGAGGGPPVVETRRPVAAGEALTFDYWQGKEGGFSRAQWEKTWRALKCARTLVAEKISAGDLWGRLKKRVV